MADLVEGLQRRWWTVQRFGLSPSKIARRVVDRQAPSVLCVTVPKAGTHLIERVLCLHPSLHRRLVPTLHEGNVYERGRFRDLAGRLRPGEVLVGHLPFKPFFAAAAQANGVRTVVLIRDPRDIAVSEAFYLASRQDHPLHADFAALPDLRSRLRASIEGLDGRLAPLEERLGVYAGWLGLGDGALVVRFEDLIGPRGGGSAAAQLWTVERIFAYLGLRVPEDRLRRLVRQAFSGASPTFRQGAIGSWREHFDDELTDLYRRRVDGLALAAAYDD